jgi:hypothetical protein
MLTIFTIPKPFKGHIETIQLNAIRSWTLLQPACEIVLCGNAHGVKETAVEFGVRHLPDIAVNEFGTPLVSSTFEQISKMAKHSILCYVNADIILLKDLLEATQRVHFHTFLMVGKHLNVDLNEHLDFDRPDWSSRLIEFAKSEGELGPPVGIDYFVFTPNGKLEMLPPFAVGRPAWDNWFIYNARRLAVPIIDATRIVTVIHQNHGYSHISQKSGKKWQGPEAMRNCALSAETIGVSDYLFSILDSTYIMTPTVLLPALSPKYLWRHCRSWLVLYPTLRPIHHMLRRLRHFVLSRFSF